MTHVHWWRSEISAAIRMKLIRFIWMLESDSKSPQSPLVNTAPYGGQIENLWGKVHDTSESQPHVPSRSGDLRTQKLKSHLVRIQSLNVLPLKPGVGQYTAIHAGLTARVFFLAYFYPSSPFTCIFSKTSPNFSCWLWLIHSSCVSLQNKIGHPVWCRFLCWVPAEYKLAKKKKILVVWWLVK